MSTTVWDRFSYPVSLVESRSPLLLSSLATLCHNLPVILFLYLLRVLLIRVALATVALALIALAFDLGDQGRRLASDLGWGPVLQAALLHLPLVTVQILPAALLLGSTLGLAALRGRGELAGLAVAGAGPGKVRRPLLAAGLICVVAAFVLDEALVPAWERAADELYQHRRISPLTGLRPSSSWVRLGRWFLHRKLTSGREEVLALEVDERFQITRRVEGSAGRWRTRQLRGQGGPVDLRPLQRRARALWSRSLVRAESLGALALYRHLRLRGEAGQQRPAETLVLHTKLAYPLVNLVAAMLACLFCGAWRRRSTVLELLAAVGLVLGLWLLLAGGWMLARGGWLSPAAGVWSPLALALGLALLSLWLQGRTKPRAY